MTPAKNRNSHQTQNRNGRKFNSKRSPLNTILDIKNGYDYIVIPEEGFFSSSSSEAVCIVLAESCNSIFGLLSRLSS